MKRLCLAVATVLLVAAGPSEIAWQSWSDAIFTRAEKENRLVLLDLEAVWCHWCHVMDEKTYRDPRVVKLLREKYVAVRVDQDARPDLSRRYRDYGWPATILFDSKGRELAKLSGFVPPEKLSALLAKLAANPVPEPSVAVTEEPPPASAFLDEGLRKKLRFEYVDQYDAEDGGWGSIHKFLFGESEELGLRGAWRQNADDVKRVRETLRLNRALFDEVWGGVYQYSVGGWDEPHFEKIAEAQHKNLFLYSLAFALWGDNGHRSAADAVYSFIDNFLRGPDGAYYTSQDADAVKGKPSADYFKLDDKSRRKIGVPAVDKNIYARENGWFVEALCAYWAATGKTEALERAKSAAAWVEKHRSLGDGGFRHGESDPAGPYLGDTLEMGNAFLALYATTADRSWLEKAKAAARFLQANFSHTIAGKTAGFKASKTPIAASLPSEPDRKENIRAARFANRLFHYTGDAAFKATAEQAMRFLARPSVAKRLPTAGVLLADLELSTDPVHLTVVGAKADPKAQALWAAAQAYPTSYKRTEWWDASEGPLPRTDVQYPKLQRPALFACTNGRCSLPIFDAAEARAKIDRLYRKS